MWQAGRNTGLGLKRKSRQKVDLRRGASNPQECYDLQRSEPT